MKRAPLPVPQWIASKRDGGELPDDALRAFVDGVVDARIPDYQISAFLMAVVWRGMTPRELTTWTRAMTDSGERLDFRRVKGTKVDKHSTGGVGDKVTLCLAPLVAACGVPAPMLVGRALGHTGGTLDKMESLPGWRARLSASELQRVLARAGFFIAGQTPRIAPADRVLYALRDATATVESIPLIASSILSKKIAGGADALVMDVKMGRGAFLPTAAATRRLARTIVTLGNAAGLRTVAYLTAMDEPLGDEVGNASELREAIAVLRGEGPADTVALTLRLGAEMLVQGRVARDRRDGERRLNDALLSGAGLERFRAGVAAQGGDARFVDAPERLPRARRSWVVRASRAGVVDVVDARAVGQAATVLGAGRARKEDTVDHAVGITVHRRGGDRVSRGEPLGTVWYNDASRLSLARPFVERAFRVGDETPPTGRLIRGFLE